MKFKIKSLYCIAFALQFFIILSLMLTPTSLNAQTEVTKNAQVETSHAGTGIRVAPGELLPISVKLSNFGGGKRVDVLIRYSIFNEAGEEIYGNDETVAVETTANFVKTIQVPVGAAPGNYIAKTSITYGGQKVPATTQFSFTVERKIFGMFQSDLITFGGIIAVVGVIMIFLGRALRKHRRSMRLTPFDYSAIPHDVRTYYEILSDTIMEMRGRVGDEALLIAAAVDGLEINKETGQVISISGRPSKIIATLVFEYENLLGEKASFSLRKSGQKI
ncbi:MAG TPA: hypothetical protein VK675_02625 [Candidatus Paceibacterota bacterium]|nr:hypothetical protein [Candidatus Paceibacterota bacterium]